MSVLDPRVEELIAQAKETEAEKASSSFAIEYHWAKVGKKTEALLSRIYELEEHITEYEDRHGSECGCDYCETINSCYRNVKKRDEKRKA